MEFKNQKEAEKFYRKDGWDIIHPVSTIDRSKCEHVWQRVSENDYQCAKCRLGFIGDPNG